MKNITDFKGKIVLITGGSSGIGLAVAEKFISMGSTVVLIARNESRLCKAASSLGNDCLHRSVDIRNSGELISLREWMVAEVGKPHIVINSAGFSHPGRLEEIPDDKIEDMIDINLKGTINVCRTFIQTMETPGHIVNISSAVGFVGIFGYSPYAASKFGIDGFSESLRMELRSKGIGVSVVYPPDTRTPQFDYEEKYKPPELKRITGVIKPIEPGIVADAIIDGIKHGRFRVYPTISIGLTHFAVRHFPSVVRWWMDRKVG